MFFRLIFNYTDADGIMHFSAVRLYKGTSLIAEEYPNLMYNRNEQKFENLKEHKLENFEKDLIFQAELESELLSAMSVS